MDNPEIILREMKKEDSINLKKEFENQGWYRSTELFESYFLDQKQKDRFVIVAEYEGFVAGYVPLLKHAKKGSFSKIITLGVGLHEGYGLAQRLYIKRGIFQMVQEYGTKINH